MTDVALKDYLEAQIRSLREYTDQALTANQRALELEARALHSRFEQHNEFREQVLQERGVFVRRELLDSIYDRLTRLELAASAVSGRWAGVALMASLLGAVGGSAVTRWLGGP